MALLEKRIRGIEANYGIGGPKKETVIIVMPDETLEMVQEKKLAEIGGAVDDHYWKVLNVKFVTP